MLGDAESAKGSREGFERLIGQRRSGNEGDFFPLFELEFLGCRDFGLTLGLNGSENIGQSRGEVSLVPPGDQVISDRDRISQVHVDALGAVGGRGMGRIAHQ